MTPERWNQVKELFQQALDLDGGRRGEFLDQACRGDETLRREVELLMAAHSQAASFIETPPQALAAEMVAPRQERLRVGQVIGHYRIVSPLGAGGVGEVYLANDSHLKRKVAIKVLRPDSLEDEDRSRKRLIREAQAAAKLDHPNICAIHEVGQEGDLTFIVMQYVEGETVADRLKRGPLELAEGLEVAAQVADALAEAHSRGITHRDIKPANIMLTSRGRVKVLDFGLAKLPLSRESTHSGSVTQSQLTDPGTVMGTVAYMSPEQLRGDPIDARTDIFSLGVSLYEMLSGQRPFDGPNNLMLMVDIVSGEPRPLGALRPGLCTDLDRIISKALTKSPSDRYQTAEEMRRDLLNAVSEGHTTGRVSEAVTGQMSHSALAPAGPARWRRFPQVAAVVILLSLVTLGAIRWFLFRSDHNGLSSFNLVPVAGWKSEPGDTRAGRATFSRDGRMIAYSMIKSGDRNIWIKQASGDGGEPHQVTKGKWTDYSPVWSPDNQEIAFVSDRGGHIGIWTILAPWADDPRLLKSMEPGNPNTLVLVCWSRNGAALYYQFEYNLFSLDIRSKEIRQVTHFEPLSERAFSLSPSEDKIVYVDTRDGQTDLWLTDFKESKPVRITDDAPEDYHPVWHPDGNRIIYSSKRSGGFQICVAYTDGRQPVQITAEDRDILASDVSADGTKILYTSTRDEANIWGANIDSGEEFEVTSATDVDLWPNVSPDGHSIAYQSTRALTAGADFPTGWIAVKGIIGGRPSKLNRGFEPIWSPDGARIAFLRSSGEGSFNIWTIPATGGEEKQVTADGIFFGGFAQLPCNPLSRDYTWSPDGKVIAYCSPFVGDTAVWAVSLDTGAKTKLSSDTNEDYYSTPLFSAEGNRIAFVSKSRTKPTGQNQITRVWIKEPERAPYIIHQTDSFVRLVGWRVPSNEVLVVSTEMRWSSQRPIEVSLSAISVADSTVRTITRQSMYLFNIVSSPDGKLVAFTSRQDGKDNVWVISSTGGTPKKVTLNADPMLYYSSLAWSSDNKAIYYGKQARQSVISMIDNFK